PSASEGSAQRLLSPDASSRTRGGPSSFVRNVAARDREEARNLGRAVPESLDDRISARHSDDADPAAAQQRDDQRSQRGVGRYQKEGAPARLESGERLLESGGLPRRLRQDARLEPSGMRFDRGRYAEERRREFRFVRSKSKRKVVRIGGDDEI